MKRQLLASLDSRTGIARALGSFFGEEIPASAGWPQVLGSVALFLFLTQAFTGILLAFNFAPIAGESYNSLRYIVGELTGGRLIRGLHHWGASMMIAVVVLHMAQVFLYGAYKKPREATWIAGVVLLLITLAYGLTGYLLPWDNRAYWGTIVVTRIAGQAPLLGPYLARLLGSNGSIGVVTFARFYALHVLLLPALTVLFLLFHLALVRKHGITPASGDLGPKAKFFPGQVFKDTLAIFAAFVILFVLAVAADVPLGRLADPTDTSYVPRPDWYFLFLFQTLKLFKGPLELLGSVVLPALAILALLSVPFVNRGAVRTLARRTAAFAALCLAVLCWTGLTLTAVATTPPESVAALTPASGPRSWSQLSPEELAGLGYFRKENCASCHNLGRGPKKIGPDLGAAPFARSAAWMIEHFKRPSQLMPGTAMPAIQLDDARLNTLAAFLLKLTPANAAALASAPPFAVEGALIYQADRCGTCHLANGVGMRLGPPLNGVSSRRSRDWIEKHFQDPQALSPGSIMPAYKFTARQTERLTAYLLSLPPAQ